MPAFLIRVAFAYASAFGRLWHTKYNMPIALNCRACHDAFILFWTKRGKSGVETLPL